MSRLSASCLGFTRNFRFLAELCIIFPLLLLLHSLSLSTKDQKFKFNLGSRAPSTKQNNGRIKTKLQKSQRRAPAHIGNLAQLERSASESSTRPALCPLSHEPYALFKVIKCIGFVRPNQWRDKILRCTSVSSCVHENSV